MSDIIDKIHADHRRFSALLARLEEQIDVFARGERPDFDLIRDIVDFLREWPARCHHPREEALLRLLEREAPEALRETGDLRREHERLAAQLANVADGLASILMEVEIARDTFVAMARNFIARQKDHLAVEEAVMLPLARKRLPERELERLADEVELPEECRSLKRYERLLETAGTDG